MADQAQKQQAVRLIARGVAALKANDMQRARQLLLEARKLDPENTDSLLWLTSTTRDTEQRRQILGQVLKINPAHPQALKALAKLEGRPVPVEPPPPAPQADAALEDADSPEVAESDEVLPTAGLVAEAPADAPSSGTSPLLSRLEPSAEASEPIAETLPEVPPEAVAAAPEIASERPVEAAAPLEF